jgi:hypothetical protein
LNREPPPPWDRGARHILVTDDDIALAMERFEALAARGDVKEKRSRE